MSSSYESADYDGAATILKVLDKLGDLKSVVDAVGQESPSEMIEAGLRILAQHNQAGTLVSVLKASGFLVSDFEDLNRRITHLQKKAWESKVKVLASEIGFIMGYQ